jgi:hypothetical protein
MPSAFNPGSCGAVAVTLLGVGVVDDVGPGVGHGQPGLEVDRAEDAGVGVGDGGEAQRRGRREVEVQGAPGLEFELPDAYEGLAPGAFVPLRERGEVAICSLAVRGDCEPVAGVGEG